MTKNQDNSTNVLLTKAQREASETKRGRRGTGFGYGGKSGIRKLLEAGKKTVQHASNVPMKPLRQYHLDDKALKKVKSKAADNAGRYPNPQGSGAYWGFVEAMITLGIDKWHETSAIFAQTKIELKAREVGTKDSKHTLWDTYYNRAKVDAKEQLEKVDDIKNPSTSRIVARARVLIAERLTRNCFVLQRLSGDHPYGYRLMQCAGGIQIVSDGETLAVKLQTFKSTAQVKATVTTLEDHAVKGKLSDELLTLFPEWAEASNEVETKTETAEPGTETETEPELEEAATS